MKLCLSLLASVLFILPETVLLADEARPTATYEDFLEWGNRLEGRWVGKITLIADWPGLNKKKGDVVPGHVTYRWVADKRGIEESAYLANEEAKRLHYWDAGSGQIKLVSVTSGGTTFVVSMGRDGNKWPWTAQGSLAAGTKMEGTGVDTLTTDGRFVVDGTVSLGGKELPELHDVYEKVSK
jgi:hypothetical protein